MTNFSYEYTVTMGDVNAMGNFYFLKYFELQGHVRELWLKHDIPNCLEVLNHHLLSTKSAHCDFKVPFFLYDIIVVKMFTTDVQRVSAKLHFHFYLKGNDSLRASGYQMVVCKDKDRKTCRMPVSLVNALKALLIH